MFCLHSLRLIVLHVFSLASGVFDWLRVCGLCMVWMDMLVNPQISLTLVGHVSGHHVRIQPLCVLGMCTGLEYFASDYDGRDVSCGE